MKYKYDLDYKDNLMEIFRILKEYTSLKKVLFIVPFFNNSIKESILNSLEELGICSKLLNIRNSDYEFHDRFWFFMMENAFSPYGFVIGTSLNGIGKKITLVATIPENDLEELCDLLTSNNSPYREDLKNWLEN